MFDHPEVAAELAAVLSATPGPVAVLVDDAELLLRTEVGTVLGRIVDRTAGEGRALAFAGDADALVGGLTGWHAEARRYRTGALLSPQGLIDGELIGVRLPRSAVGGAVTPGRALVHLGDGRLRTVQVPELSDRLLGRE
jgi:S-DNA-T family DNA segregation ATPase FtsK/SpoIIIE